MGSRRLPWGDAHRRGTAPAAHETGRSPGGAEYRSYAESAALIADLARAGRVEITDEKRPRVIVRTPEQTGDPVLDHGLAAVAQRDGRRLESLITWSRLDPTDAVAASLIGAGVLAEGKRAFLGLGKPLTPEVDPTPEARIRSRLSDVIAGRTAASEQDVILLATIRGLGSAHRILGVEAGGLGRRELNARIDALVQDAPVGIAVKRAVAAVQAAIIAAGASAAVAGAAGSS